MTASANLKGSKYLGLLQEARLHSQWSQVPELARKTDKHAEQRTCLRITAGIEAQIASNYRQGDRANREQADNAAEDALAVLAQVIGVEVLHAEDAFEARVCIQDIHHNLGHWDAVIGNIRKEIDQELDDISRKFSDLPPYLRICVLKSKYCLASALEHRHQYDDARDVYQATVSYINTFPTAVALYPEARYWIVRVLARSCALDMQDFDSDNTENAMSALKAFRTWSKFWAGQSTWQTGDLDPAGPDTRRRIWGLYYHLLSTLLDMSKDHSPTYVKKSVGSDATTTTGDYFTSRLAQQTELRHVEHAYESVLLDEIKFPRAHQDNRQIDLWATQLMLNWRTLAGIHWRDSDLDKGGKIALGRNVLAMLYRAAAKTFHSTAILRYLFQVHAALADLDLAIKAFDSYLEIVKKCRARAKKTGQNELGLDTEDTVYYTAADCINLMCTYGAREQAERALDVAAVIANWLGSDSIASSSAVDTTSPASTIAATPISKMTLASTNAQAAAYRAIGQSKAHWARLTYDPSARSILLSEARQNLEHATTMLHPPEPDIETARLLALVLTELGDINSAIRVLKKILMANTQDAPRAIRLQVHLAAEQCQLLPLWHHLVLLLTAKEEYETAFSTCNLALSHYIDPLQTLMRDPTSQDDLILETPSEVPHMSALDVYTDQDKANLIQLKLTELELVCDLEGAPAAVSRISEPLSLYARLFGTSSKQERPDTSNAQSTIPAKVAVSSLRKSFRNSILGRPKSMARSVLNPTIFEPVQDTTSTIGEKEPTSPTSPHSTNGEFGQIPQSSGTGLLGSLHKSHPANRLSAPPMNDTLRGNMAQMATAPEVVTRAAAQTVVGSKKSSPSKRVISMRSNKSAPVEQPTMQTTYPDVIDLEAPRPKAHSSVVAALSTPLFPPLVRQRHAHCILVDSWLFVASIYARDELRDNQDQAIEEAAKLVEAINIDAVASDPSARAFDDRGWGWGKSSGRLWADVLTERGNLAVSTGRPFDAMKAFESALDSLPDHPGAVLGLSGLLLDLYEQRIPAEPPSASSKLLETANESQVHARIHSDRPFLDALHETVDGEPKDIAPPDGIDQRDNTLKTGLNLPGEAVTDATPAELNRIAARARATGMLSALTKLGESWADSELWYVLARAYELSGQNARAKECLWWVIKLEDAKPLRPWRVCTASSAW